MKVFLFLILLVLISCARTPALRSAGENPIAVLGKILVNGDEQQLLIRGENQNNPILLFLHGGPGMPMMYLSHRFQRDLEKNFIVVHWDQRLAGKSFKKAFDTEKIRVSQYLSDAQVVVEYLRQKFNQKQVLLAGHSWGSYLGILLASKHPDLFSAYIGIGQVVDDPKALNLQKNFLQNIALKTKDQKAQNRLSKGTSWYEHYLFKYGAELKHHKSFWPLVWAGFGSTEYTFKDILNVKRGSSASSKLMAFDVTRNLMKDANKLETPVFFIMGTVDMVTPLALVQAYFEEMEAPYKELILFEESAHFPFFEEPKLFTRCVTEILRKVKKRGF